MFVVNTERKKLLAISRRTCAVTVTRGPKKVVE
jgi:hypothetical protein